MMPAKVLVTGSSGTVGAALIRNAPKNLKVLTPSHLELELTDYGRTLNYLKINEIDSVILAAARVGGIKANISNQHQYLLENLNIQNTIINAAYNYGVANLLFLGSSCAYPTNVSIPLQEHQLLSGRLESTNEGYALAKIAGIKMCEYIFRSSGRNFFSLMPSNIYGPHDNFDLETAHVPAALLRRMHEAKINNFPGIKIWGTGNPRREFLHVDDLAKACWFFLEKDVGGELINIGTGKEISILDFASKVAKTVDYHGRLEFDLESPDGVLSKLLNVAKAESFGWQSTIPLDRGLQNTYDWFRKAYEEGDFRGA